MNNAISTCRPARPVAFYLNSWRDTWGDPWDGRKERAVAEARAAVAERWPDVPAGRACLHLAAAICRALHARGTRAILQAGSLYWRAVAHAYDDGRGPTHYSYVYSPGDPLSAAAEASGYLPEMHCWAAIPATGEIIDLTTCGFRELAAAAGMEWTAPPPPPFLWCQAADVSERYAAVYRPEPAAIVRALQFAGRLGRDVLEAAAGGR